MAGTRAFLIPVCTLACIVGCLAGAASDDESSLLQTVTQTQPQLDAHESLLELLRGEDVQSALVRISQDPPSPKFMGLERAFTEGVGATLAPETSSPPPEIAYIQDEMRKKMRSGELAPDPTKTMVLLQQQGLTGNMSWPAGFSKAVHERLVQSAEEFRQSDAIQEHLVALLPKMHALLADHANLFEPLAMGAKHFHEQNASSPELRVEQFPELLSHTTLAAQRLGLVGGEGSEDTGSHAGRREKLELEGVLPSAFISTDHGIKWSPASKTGMSYTLTFGYTNGKVLDGFRGNIRALLEMSYQFPSGLSLGVQAGPRFHITPDDQLDKDKCKRGLWPYAFTEVALKWAKKDAVETAAGSGHTASYVESTTVGPGLKYLPAGGPFKAVVGDLRLGFNFNSASGFKLATLLRAGGVIRDPLPDPAPWKLSINTNVLAFPNLSVKGFFVKC